jgi:oligopeptide/dipeptide ABC transporter ATP-binding protein
MPARDRLTVEDLRVSFARGSLEAVRGVSLTIAPGEAYGLVGESGSGKSLTCRAILGLTPPGAAVSGRITYGTTSLLDVGEEEMERLRGSRIAMIFQDPMASLNPVLTVGEAIAQIVRSHAPMDRAAARRRAVEMMERVGIREAAKRADAYPHQFSGGMRQRILIAMALSARPSLLLADEPTTALDVIVQAEILRLLDRLRREERMSMLFVSHNLAVVANICERVGVMYAGELVEEGPTREVLLDPRMPYTAGLIASMPGPRASGRLRSIAGAPPALHESTAGCRFAPRCPLSDDDCRQQRIPLIDVGTHRQARCIRSERVSAMAAPVEPSARPERLASMEQDGA